VIDVDRLRSDTPGTDHVIHFDNAGASLMPTPVLEAVHRYLDVEMRVGGYAARKDMTPAIDAAYDSVARLIGAHPGDIAMTDAASRAWQLAFHSLGLGEGDRVLTTETEYVANWAAYVQVRRERGVVIDVVPSDDAGDIDLDALERMIDDRVALISINHAPTNCGVILDVEAVGRIANGHGIPYLVDACQSVGQVPVDVRAIGCDMLSSTSRKYLRGPRGVGFLYVREEFLDRMNPVFVETGSSQRVGLDDYVLAPGPRRFENFEKNYAGVVGMGVAADYALEIGIPAIRDRIQYLAGELRKLLATIDGVTVLDVGTTQGGAVTFNLVGVAAEDLALAARQSAINVSVSTINSAPFDMQHRGIDQLVRASLHAFNTEDELATFAAFVDGLRSGVS